MARPIKETPILYGEDAERFVQQMEEVEARSQEEREESRKKFQERVKEAKKYITFCL
jgi:F0F1-type ATP synthase membrane subunit b/b'